jgi:hypothetical protein
VYFVGQYWFIFVQVGYMIQYGTHDESLQQEDINELGLYTQHQSFIMNDGWDIHDKTALE